MYTSPRAFMLFRNIANRGIARRRLESLAQLNASTAFSASTYKPMALPTLHKIPASSLHVSKPVWWLESRFHFSFADWHDESRMSFGPLRVLNDDLVKPHAGFGKHPHRDAEIFSYVVDGFLSHADSMGNKEALPRGSVQYLSAGTGITHSEMNDGDSTCRFLQIWFTPDKRGHLPQYGSTQYSKDDRHNQLLQVLGGTTAPPAWQQATGSTKPIQLHQDVNVFVSECDPNTKFDVSLREGRQAYVVCIEGGMVACGDELAARDALEIVAPEGTAVPVTLQAGAEGAHFMVIEMVQNSARLF